MEIHPVVTILSEGFLFYSVIEFLIEVSAVYLMRVSGWYIGPAFDKPYLATSPRDFWGRRWNLWVQEFQYTNIFEPIRQAGYSTTVAILGVNIFACAFHEYMVYVAWINFEWTGHMTLFFTIHFAAAMIEVYFGKAQLSKYVPALFCHSNFKIFLTIMFLASTGHLFVRPMFEVWTIKTGLVSGLKGKYLASLVGAT